VTTRKNVPPGLNVLKIKNKQKSQIPILKLEFGIFYLELTLKLEFGILKIWNLFLSFSF